MLPNNVTPVLSSLKALTKMVKTNNQNMYASKALSPIHLEEGQYYFFFLVGEDMGTYVTVTENIHTEV